MPPTATAGGAVGHGVHWGQPVQAEWDNFSGGLVDGFGLCSPSRWAPERRGFGLSDDARALCGQVLQLAEKYVTSAIPDLRGMAFLRWCPRWLQDGVGFSASYASGGCFGAERAEVSSTHDCSVSGHYWGSGYSDLGGGYRFLCYRRPCRIQREDPAIPWCVPSEVPSEQAG